MTGPLIARRVLNIEVDQILNLAGEEYLVTSVQEMKSGARIVGLAALDAPDTDPKTRVFLPGDPVDIAMSPDERLTHFISGRRGDDTAVASYVREFFPEIYDEAVAFAKRTRAACSPREAA